MEAPICKTGDPANCPYGHGPQGDVVRIDHFIRLVRGNSVADVEEIESKTKINVYPNHSNGNLKVLIPDETKQLLLSDIHGRTILKENIQTSGIKELNIGASGVYFVQLIFGNSVSEAKIIVLD